MTPSPFARRRPRLATGLLITTVITLASTGASTGASAKDIADVNAPGFLRVTGNDVVSLDIATRRYTREGGPDVTLAAVVHIGDRAYYRTLQGLLDEHDVVLYESVKPEGTGGAGGETPEIRRASTRAAVQYVAGVIEAHRQALDRYPRSLEELRRFAADTSLREAAFLDAALVDAWGGSLEYHVDAVEDASPAYELRSDGADRAPGGEGEDADIVVAGRGFASPPQRRAEDNLQVQLARALELDFQLEAIDYERLHWRCSDMSMDQLERAMAAAGSDFTVVESTLAGTSFPARFVRLLLGMLRVADTFMDGALSDTFKVVLIEMLGDETMISQALAQVDESFAKVIIEDRNAVVADDLVQLLEQEPDVGSVAIFYGAGHMADLAKRLSALGYQPADTTWHRAISVDTASSAVSKAELNRMRFMIRRSMRQMYGG